MTDDEAIALALAEAEACVTRGEVPVGAVLLSAEGALLASDGNRILERRDPTAHAEMLVLRKAAEKLGNERLTGTNLFASLEPCAMCAGAMS
ncbi:MAG TPA: nucleoside deaminase, partial [Rhizomicrobium sp.]|nr:nucleoside deaminase [Rhizomicrobium sp.]